MVEVDPRFFVSQLLAGVGADWEPDESVGVGVGVLRELERRVVDVDQAPLFDAPKLLVFDDVLFAELILRRGGWQPFAELFGLDGAQVAPFLGGWHVIPRHQGRVAVESFQSEFLSVGTGFEKA